MPNSTEHTDKKYEEELKNLREEILYMGGLVEDQIQKAVTSLVDRDSELAKVIIERDHEVNRLDVEIDERCIKLLALHQPAGRDLRFITTGLKITTDLERIGDMAVNICERCLELNQEPQLKPLIDIPRMSEIAAVMLRQSLDAFVRGDVDLALKVCRDDDMIVSGGENVFPAEVEDVLLQHPQIADAAVIGVPHARTGESVAAWVVPEPGETLTVEGVRDYAAKHLARYKVPATVEIVDALPRNEAGKLLRRALRFSS